MAEQEPGMEAVCACLYVHYSPEEIVIKGGGIDGKDVHGQRSRWLCTRCDREFMPVAFHLSIKEQWEAERVADEAELCRLRAEVNKHIARIHREVARVTRLRTERNELRQQLEQKRLRISELLEYAPQSERIYELLRELAEA